MEVTDFVKGTINNRNEKICGEHFSKSLKQRLKLTKILPPSASEISKIRDSLMINENRYTSCLNVLL